MQETYARAFRSWRVVHARDEPPRLAAAHPHEPEHRPRPPRAADAGSAAARGGRLLPLQPARGGHAERADEERVLERLSQDHVVEALAAVPHDFRDVLVLVDIGEFSYAEAAQILDIPIGTVMSRLHRGRRILKQQLAELAVEAAMSEVDPCDWCEEVMQPYLDRDLNDDRASRRPRRTSTAAATARSAISSRRACGASCGRRRSSRWSPALKAKLAALRLELYERLGQILRQVDVARRAEVVARDEQRRQRACALVRDLIPDGSGEHDRVAAVAAVRRGHDLRAALAPDLEHAVDRGRGQVRAVGEHDDRGLDVVSEALQAAAERGAGAALPVGAVDDRAPTSRRSCAPSTTTTSSTELAANAFEHRLEQERCLTRRSAWPLRPRGRPQPSADVSSILSIVTFSVGAPDGSAGLPSLPIFSTTSMPSVTLPRTA